MARALKLIHGIWAWLARYGAERARNDRRAANLLVELDARTIRDVGLEGWRSPLGAEVERRRHLARRWDRAARFGFF